MEDDEEEPVAPKSIADLENQIKALENRSAKVIESAKDDTDSEVTKARHVKNQKTLMDHLLDVRIKMHPALQVANRLPQGESFVAFAKDPQIAQGLSTASVLVESSMVMLYNMKLELSQGYPDTKEAASKRRKLADDYSATIPEWSAMLAQLEQDFEPSYRSSIDKWNSRTQIASGVMHKKLTSINTVLDNANLARPS